jgi:primosomal protein N' (replication factor Y)
MSEPRVVLRIALPAPHPEPFDYLPPTGLPEGAAQPGMRVRVPFGRRHAIGLIWACATGSRLPRERLKPVGELLDDTPLLDDELLGLAQGIATYYHQPPGLVAAMMLPVALRQGRRDAHDSVAETSPVVDMDRTSPPALNADQQAAVDAIAGAIGGFQVFLLEGVTGSGKTEVYLRLIERLAARNQQALVLAPEIGLVPQLAARIGGRLGRPPALLHSALGERARLDAWRAARNGEAGVVLGTRSALFAPLPQPGIIIVDEEHDLAYKQQDGVRYHARDVAILRARRLGVPVVLGSATPSLESLHNTVRGRYRLLRLPQRAGLARAPSVSVIDLRARRLDAGLSETLCERIGEHLAADGQVLVFHNRRGYAPTLLCHGCGWVARCTRCDARLVWHQASSALHCHHCDARRARPEVCPDCGSSALRALGAGTERLAQTLAARFPAANAARVDRDSTRRRGALPALLDGAQRGEHRLLIGTQMIAKGHDFPAVTLAAIVDADHGLYSADFRAGERMAQLIVQVAGRAGRAERAGELILQTHHPDHPQLRLLLDAGYARYAEAALAERRTAQMPPYSHLALLHAECTRPEPAQQFLAAARRAGEALSVKGVDWYGPMAAPMEKRAGRYRAHLLLQATRRQDLQTLLGLWVSGLYALPEARRTRFALDVDPMEL